MCAFFDNISVRPPCSSSSALAAMSTTVPTVVPPTVPLVVPHIVSSGNSESIFTPVAILSAPEAIAPPNPPAMTAKSSSFAPAAKSHKGMF